MHSEGILSGELKHGPLAMIDDKMPVIMIITKDGTHKVTFAYTNLSPTHSFCALSEMSQRIRASVSSYGKVSLMC